MRQRFARGGDVRQQLLPEEDEGNVSELVLPDEWKRGQWVDGLGAKWMGGGFDDTDYAPRQDYWGYWHNEESRSQDIGFRILLDPTDHDHRFKHQTPYDRERR